MLGLCICLFLLTFIAYCNEKLLGIALMIYGFITIIGALFRFSWLVVGSIIFWG